MPGMLWECSKHHLVRVDDICNGPRRDEFLAALRNNVPMPDIIENFEIARNVAERNHLKHKFFRDWWPQAQALAGGSGVEKVFREGLAQAIENAGDRKIDCYWMWQPATDGAAVVALCRSAQQMTFILQTPKPPQQEESVDEIIVVKADENDIQVHSGISGD